MNRIHFFHSIAVLIFSSMVFMAACSKSSSPADDVSYATDHLIAEQVFNDAENIADAAATLPTGSTLTYRVTGVTIGECATVTHNGSEITVDFGTTDCAGTDGRSRRGKIDITYTMTNYTDSGSVHTITFDNFYQDDNLVSGTKTVTNMGHNDSGRLYYNIGIKGTITLASGIISVDWTRVRTQTGGSGTVTYLTDDVYQLTGTGSMTDAKGAVTTISITAPLVIANNCHWVEAGTVSYTLSTGESSILNYGDVPACDDQAALTPANGAARTITLP